MKETLEQTRQAARERLCEGMFSKGNNVIYLREEEPGGGQGVGGRACRNLNFQTWGWGSKGLPNPNQELFTEFYVFWVLPGGSFPQLSEAQTHFCHS